MRRMNEAEICAFLTFGTRTGKLGVTRLDCSPMVVPMVRRRRRHAALHDVGREHQGQVAAPRRARVAVRGRGLPAVRYVRVDGTTTLLDDPELLRSWAARIGGRYMGAERAAEYGARNGVEGELLVRITPTRIVAQAGIAD